MNSVLVTVWVCFNCGNYYGASSAGDLSREKQATPGRPNSASLMRSACPTPTCMQRGLHRERCVAEVNAPSAAGEAA